jgi:hypothetical protein
MPTLVWGTGWEYGVNPVTNGGGLADVVTGTPTVVTTPVRSGTYALSINPAAATENMRKNLSSQIVVERRYVRLETLPAATSELWRFASTGTADLKINYNQPDNKFELVYTGGGVAQLSSMTVSADQWYRFDLKLDHSVDPHTADWQVDGVAQTQTVSPAQVADNVTSVYFGAFGAVTIDVYFDDVYISYTAADYPIGDSEIKKLSPDADGTHSPATPDCIRGGGASPALISGSNTAFQYMDDVPFPTGAAPTTDRINQDITAGHTTHYVETTFPDISETTINGVIGLLAYGGDSATANNGSTKAVRSDATEINIYAGDMSETTVFYKFAVVTAPGGGWTQAEVNALKMRQGYSTDITPNPFWQATMLEYDSVPGGAPPADTLIAPLIVSQAINRSATW